MRREPVPPFRPTTRTTTAPRSSPPESCPRIPTAPGASSSVAGVAFYPGGPFPNSYDGALFCADYSRDFIWIMFPGTKGLPNPRTRARGTTLQAPG